MIRAARASQAQRILVQHRPQPGEPDLREFTWYYLMSRCHTERRTLTGNRGDVYHVEFSPRGDLLASAGKDGFIQIWNTASWELVLRFKASETEVNVAAFSPDGKSLATADDEGKLKIWQLATGRCEWEESAHKGDAVIARFTPDGKRIITGGRKDGFVRFWDRSTGDLLGSLTGYGFLLSPDGSTLATLGAEGEINLYNSSTRAPYRFAATGPRDTGRGLLARRDQAGDRS